MSVIWCSPSLRTHLQRLYMNTSGEAGVFASRRSDLVVFSLSALVSFVISPPSFWSVSPHCCWVSAFLCFSSLFVNLSLYSLVQSGWEGFSQRVWQISPTFLIPLHICCQAFFSRLKKQSVDFCTSSCCCSDQNESLRTSQWHQQQCAFASRCDESPY